MMKIGYFGKLPGYGDFINRNVSPALIKYWDNWILQSIDCSRGQLKEHWKLKYFNSPIWRFVVSEGVYSDSSISGIMMPSVDKAGRCFPFIVVCQAESQVNTFIFARKIDELHEHAEEFVLELLEKNKPNLDDIQNVLEKIYKSANESLYLSANSVPTSSAMEIGAIADHKLNDFSTCNESFLEALLQMKKVRPTIWWMSGGIGFEPQKRYFSGMPPVESYHSFLIGVEN